MSNTHVVYHSLHRSEIRLLTLAAGEWHEDIRCQLIYAPLPNKPIFNALSYAWGSSKTLRSIYLDGKQHPVTASVKNALQRLRQNYGATTIWVDALCINQSDENERNHQVGLMRDIFMSARKVIVYLGEVQTSCFTMAVSKMKTSSRPTTFQYGTNNKLLDSFSDHCSSSGTPRRRLDDAIEAFCLIQSIAEAQNLDDTAPFDPGSRSAADAKYQRRLFEALRQLMRCRWWDRMWTLQEVVVPRDVTIIYGPCVSTWDMFTRAASIYSKHKDAPVLSLLPRAHTKVLEFYMQTILDIEAMRERWASLDQISLLSLLRQFSGRKATDSRDRVYALLGLVRGRLPIEPNYSMNVADVFQNTALGIMDTTKTLAVLNGDIGRKLRQDLPSWVPDWSAEYHDLDRRRADTTELYRATLQSSVYVQHEGSKEWSGTLYHLESKYAERYGVKRRMFLPWNPHEIDKVLGHSDWRAFLQEDRKKYRQSQCLEAVEAYMITQGGPVCLRHHGEGIISLPGHGFSTVLAVGTINISDSDHFPVIQSWGFMAAKHTDVTDLWPSFMRTICADVVYMKDVGLSRCQRISAGDLKVIAGWFLHRSGAPFGKEETEKNRQLLPVRNALLQCFPEAEFSEKEYEALDVDYSIRLATSRKAFFITNTKNLGLGPAQTSVGDHVYVLLGGNAPFILRDKGTRDVRLRSQAPTLGSLKRSCHEMVGDCFVHDFMDGEAMASWHEVSTAVMKARVGSQKALNEWLQLLWLRSQYQTAKLELKQALKALEGPDPISTFLHYSYDLIRDRRRQRERRADLSREGDEEEFLDVTPVTLGNCAWMVQSNELEMVETEWYMEIYGHSVNMEETPKRKAKAIDTAEKIVLTKLGNIEVLEGQNKVKEDIAEREVMEWERRLVSKQVHVYLV